VLSYKEAGKIRFLTLPAADVETARAPSVRCRAAREALEARGNTGLAERAARLRKGGRAELSRPAQPARAHSSSEPFGASTAQFGRVRDFLVGGAAAVLEHVELEQYIKTSGFELLRLFLQDHFDLRATQEIRFKEVFDTGGTRHGAVEPEYEHPLATIVGTITTGHFAYRHRAE